MKLGIFLVILTAGLNVHAQVKEEIVPIRSFKCTSTLTSDRTKEQLELTGTMSDRHVTTTIGNSIFKSQRVQLDLATASKDQTVDASSESLDLDPQTVRDIAVNEETGKVFGLRVDTSGKYSCSNDDGDCLGSLYWGEDQQNKTVRQYNIQIGTDNGHPLNGTLICTLE